MSGREPPSGGPLHYEILGYYQTTGKEKERGTTEYQKCFGHQPASKWHQAFGLHQRALVDDIPTNVAPNCVRQLNEDPHST